MLHSIATVALWKAQIYSLHSPAGPLVIVPVVREKKRKKKSQGISALQPNLRHTPQATFHEWRLWRLAFSSTISPSNIWVIEYSSPFPGELPPRWSGFCCLFHLECHQSQPAKILSFTLAQILSVQSWSGILSGISNIQKQKQSIF